MTLVVAPNGRMMSVQERKGWPGAGARPRVTSARSSLEFPELGYSSRYAGIYSSQPWIYALVNKLARGVARMPLKAYTRDPDGGTNHLSAFDVPLHPLPALLARPYPRGSRFKLVEAMIGNLAIYGNALAWKFRPGPGQAPTELWPLDWRYVEMHVGGDSPIDHYQWKGPGSNIKSKFLPDDVVHLRWWSPRGEDGTSPLEPLRVTLALEDAGKRYAVSSFAHGARPSGALVIPKTLDPDQKEDLRTEIEGMNAGPDNAFRIALLDGGMDWKPFSHNAQEAETIAHRKLNREEACAVYDLPPPVVHILDRATFSNITEQNKALYRESLGAITAMVEEELMAQLLWGEADFDRTYLEFDFSEVLKPDPIERATMHKNMETTSSLNERRKIENLPPIGDVDNAQNPANGVLVPLNHALVLQTGDLVMPNGDAAPADALSGALARIVDERIDAALSGRPA